jgi:ribosome-binding protein aMBF1 (putative translation factor)
MFVRFPSPIKYTIRPYHHVNIVGERVLKIAKAAGLSRADLAERISVNQSALTHWGKGESNPSIDRVRLSNPHY